MTANRDAYLGLVVAGWVMALYLPLGGLVVGFTLVDRRPGHATGILVVSGVSLVVTVFLVLTVLDPLG